METFLRKNCQQNAGREIKGMHFFCGGGGRGLIYYGLIIIRKIEEIFLRKVLPGNIFYKSISF